MEKNHVCEEAYVNSKFEILDFMVNEYNSIDGSTSFDRKYDYFMECLDYVIQLDQEDIIVKHRNGEYNISYLKDILYNDGSEYSLTIGFFNPYKKKSSYEIGVCVRGTPLCFCSLKITK